MAELLSLKLSLSDVVVQLDCSILLAVLFIEERRQRWGRRVWRCVCVSSTAVLNSTYSPLCHVSAAFHVPLGPMRRLLTTKEGEGNLKEKKNN